MSPAVVVPARMRSAQAFILVFIIIKHRVVGLYAFVTGTKISRNVNGSIVLIAAALAMELLILVIIESQIRKPVLASTSGGSRGTCFCEGTLL